MTLFIFAVQTCIINTEDNGDTQAIEIYIFKAMYLKCGFMIDICIPTAKTRILWLLNWAEAGAKGIHK